MLRVLLYVPSHREIPRARESWLRQRAYDAWVDVLIMRYDPCPDKGAYYNLVVKDEIARKMCLAGTYDYFWHVEDDIILPDRALELLLQEEAQLISGLHRCRPETGGTDRLSVSIADPEGPQDSDDRPLTLDDITHWGSIVKCTQVSNGCLLIHKDLLKDLEGVMGLDWKMCISMYPKYIPILCHTGVLCGHVGIDGTIWEVQQ